MYHNDDEGFQTRICRFHASEFMQNIELLQKKLIYKLILKYLLINIVVEI